MASSILQGVVSPSVGQGLINAFAQGSDIYNTNKAAQLNRQGAQQRMSENDYQSALRKIQVANNLAKKALTLPPEQRGQLLVDSSGALQSLGFTPDDLANTPLDDQGLQNLIAQTDSALQASGGNTGGDVQQAQYVSGLGYLQQLRNGQVTLAELTPEQQAKVKAALEAEAGRQAEAYGLKTRTGLEARTEMEPTLRTRVTEAEQGVRMATEPQLQSEVAKARQLAVDEAKKLTKQQGQLSKIDDANRIYNSLGDSDLDLIYGSGEKWYPEVLRSQKGIDLMAQRDQLIGMLNLAARGELQGQGSITESEAASVLAAATTLGNPNVSPAEARTALDSAMARIYGGAGKQFTPKDQGGSGTGAMTQGIFKSKSGIQFEVK